MILTILSFTFVLLSCTVLQIHSSSSYRLSTTKPAGGILVENCSAFLDGKEYAHTIDIFPARAPQMWRSCDDAYSVTWQHDIDQHIVRLPWELRMQLISTMGFCPHLRCQLGNVSHSPNYGMCPPGLCYTKLESGARSFGACCFDSQGIFESGNLIGVASKSQAVAKPIYKHSAVLLQSLFHNNQDDFCNCSTEDASKCSPEEIICNTEHNSLDDVSMIERHWLTDHFINANRMFDGSLLITQCPHTSTIEHDIPLFIKQEDIHLWIQLAPMPSQIGQGRYADCHLLPSFLPLLERHSSMTYKSNSTGDDLWSSNSIMTRNHYIVEDITQRMQQLVLKLQSLGYSLISDAANPNRFQFEGIEIVLLSNKYNDVVHPVLYVWFQPWLDFSTPPSAFHPALKTIAEHAGEYLTNYNTLSGNNKSRPKKKVAISCLSGRGRSGSVAALIASQLMRKDTSNKFVSSINSGENGWTHATLVHLIVQLRGQRDGMVETPAQYRLLAKLSGLSDPGYEISQIGQQWPVMSYLHFQLQSRKELWLVIGISICIGIGIGAAITVSLN
jgi:hypothetical protein